MPEYFTLFFSEQCKILTMFPDNYLHQNFYTDHLLNFVELLCGNYHTRKVVCDTEMQIVNY